RPALQEQDLELVTAAGHAPRQVLGLLVHRHEMTAAMTHLDQGHARTLVVHELLLNLAQHLQRKGGRTGTEIEHPIDGAWMIHRKPRAAIGAPPSTARARTDPLTRRS